MSKSDSKKVSTTLTQDLQILEHCVDGFTVKKISKAERETRKTKKGETVKCPIVYNVTITNPMTKGKAEAHVLSGDVTSLKSQLALFKALCPDVGDLMSCRDYAEAQARVDALERALTSARENAEQARKHFEMLKRTRKADPEKLQATLRKVFSDHPPWAKIG